MTEPKTCLTQAYELGQRGLQEILGLDEKKITLAQVESIQKNLSLAASEMTKLRTYMVEHALKPETEDNNNVG